VVSFDGDEVDFGCTMGERRNSLVTLEGRFRPETVFGGNDKGNGSLRLPDPRWWYLFSTVPIIAAWYCCFVNTRISGNDARKFVFQPDNSHAPKALPITGFLQYSRFGLHADYAVLQSKLEVNDLMNLAAKPALESSSRRITAAMLPRGKTAGVKCAGVYGWRQSDDCPGSMIFRCAAAYCQAGSADRDIAHKSNYHGVGLGGRFIPQWMCETRVLYNLRSALG